MGLFGYLEDQYVKITVILNRERDEKNRVRIKRRKSTIEATFLSIDHTMDSREHSTHSPLLLPDGIGLY